VYRPELTIYGPPPGIQAMRAFCGGFSVKSRIMSSSTEWAADGGRPTPKPDHRLPPLTPADAPVEHEHEDPVPRASRPAAADVPWFLPAGRAGLAPEALDSEALDSEAGEAPGPARALPENAANIVSSPPWASEPPTADLGIPPWESGPWPARRPGDPAAPGSSAAADSRNGAAGTAGPAAAADGLAGGNRSRAGAPAAAANGAGRHAGGPAARGSAGGGSVAGGSVAGGPAAGGPALARGAGLRPGAASSVHDRRGGETLNPFAMPALIAGIAGVLVLPGLILGALGLRNGRRTGTGLVRSWLGIGLSVVWAVAIILIALPGSSPAADAGCTAYQAGARSAVSHVAAQLSAGAPAGQLHTSLGQAASQVNRAAARAQSVSVRSTLAAMTGDLQSTLSEVTAGRPVPPLLRRELTGDIAAAAHACS
jgi:hypothetical protein